MCLYWKMFWFWQAYTGDTDNFLLSVYAMGYNSNAYAILRSSVNCETIQLSWIWSTMIWSTKTISIIPLECMKRLMGCYLRNYLTLCCLVKTWLKWKFSFPPVRWQYWNTHISIMSCINGFDRRQVFYSNKIPFLTLISQLNHIQYFSPRFSMKWKNLIHGKLHKIIPNELAIH